MADVRRRKPLPLGQVVSLTDLRTRSGEFEQDEDGVDEKPTRRVVGRPLKASSLQEFKNAVRHVVLWTKAEVYRRHAPQQGSRPGRRREWDAAWLAIIEDCWTKFGSLTAIFDELADEDVVQIVRAHARALGQDLGPPPGSRTAHYRYCVDHVDDNVALQEELDSVQLDDGLLKHDVLTQDTQRGTVAFPEANEIAVGDGTWIPALTKSGQIRRVNRQTGEITLITDSHSQQLPGGQGRGQLWSSVLARVAERIDDQLVTFENERIIFDCQPSASGREAETAVAILERMKDRRSRIRGFAFDMNMGPPQIDACLNLGVTAIVKTPRVPNQGAAFGSLDYQTLRTRSGESLTVELHHLDGCPGIVRWVGEEEFFIRLTHRRDIQPHARYAIFEVPDHPLVEPSLREATYRRRSTATAAERLRGDYPTAKVRPVPECEDYFQLHFGLREDAESMHKNLKERLWAGRARSTSLGRQRMLMRGYRSRSNLRAALAHAQRTGKDLSQILLPVPQLRVRVDLPPAA